MLAIKSQGKIIERIVRAKTGEFVRAVFYVVEVNGEFQVELISARPVTEAGIKNYELGIKGTKLCLGGKCLKSPNVISYRHNYHSIISPFSNIFEFFVSQPTRAPSWN